MASNTSTRAALTLAAVALAAAAAIPFLGDVPAASDPLVVYCAHDSLFSEDILREFEEQTGIPVSIQFDTEATKSLGFVNLLIREQNAPRCDVFWNNQVLGTLDLKEAGILLPYKGKGYQRIPDEYKDPDGLWTGFAARLRVYIVNTDRMEASPGAIADAAGRDDLSRMAVAKPLYGTTRSHFTALWHAMGGEELTRWHHRVREQGLREASGNAAVMKMVASGACDFGWTDTDDFYAAFDEGKPVDMLPVRLDGGATICIPNSVSIIRGTERLEEAQQLVDFLLSAQTEDALARSQSRQIPLGPVDTVRLSADVKQLRDWAQDGYDVNSIGSARAECLAWLKSEYLK